MQTYSNSGFWLLGLIIEKASGMTYEEYVEKKIFEPLGMTRSIRQTSSPSALLTFRRSTNSGPATELRYDRGGGHFILKRQ